MPHRSSRVFQVYSDQEGDLHESGESGALRDEGQGVGTGAEMARGEMVSKKPGREWLTT